MRYWNEEHRQGLLAVLSCLSMVVTAVSRAADSEAPEMARALTLTEAIESSRFMTDRRGNAVFLSPRATRYAVVLVRGDVARDGVWWDLQVGELSSLSQARPRSVARRFTRGKGGLYGVHFGSDELTAPGMNPPVWTDERQIAFFWEDASGVRQVMAVDVESGETVPLTRHPTSVLQYGVGPGGSLIYTGSVVNDTVGRGSQRSDGYVVTDSDAMALLSGSMRGAWDWMFNERFVVRPDAPTPRRIAFNGGERVSRYLPILSTPAFSADGRLAIMPHTLEASRIPSDWAAYVMPHFREMWHAREQAPDSWYARQFETLFVVDVHTAQARPLWDVPNEPYGRTRIAWSPTGDRVLLGPTFLPPDETDEPAREGLAVAEVNVPTKRFARLPVPAQLARFIKHLSYAGAGRAAVELTDGRVLEYRKQGSAWVAAPEARPTSVDARESAADASVRIQVSVRQGLNKRPVLVARDRRTSREAVVLDPNPALGAQIRLGQVEWVSRSLADGSRWEGRLYHPVNYRPGQRYPLVFQTYAFAPRDEFSLYGHAGPALGPGRSAYIAQLLAGRDVFVLHGPSRAESISHVNTMLDALEGEIERLVADGKVDRDRVGIMGFSASGWLTTYALTRERLRYAAALTDDNKDGSYLQAALSGWSISSGEEMVGAPPFGKGLEHWLAHSPAMNVERIHTPLLITRTSPGTELLGWELFSRLRHLRKPVEYFLIPEINHGSHGLQNPAQLMALQERALDWWCYWLKGEYDPDPRKVQQYARWEELRARHEADLQLRDAYSDASL